MTIRKDASVVSIATAIGLVTAALAGGMYIGGVDADVHTIQQAMAIDDKRELRDAENAKEDHDRLIVVESKLDNIEQDIQETKVDIKEILRKLNEL